MKLKVLGAAGTVTGSSYVLTSQRGQSILIDMGMFQGPKEIEAMNYDAYDFNISSLSAAFLTHAHLDHCGRLPMLDFLGFTGDIWMSPPTKPLTELVLFDSAKIAERFSDNPLYTRDNVDRLTGRFKTLPFRKPKLIGDFEVTLIKAGHLLGAASILVKDTTSNGSIRSIVFSGDLGNNPEELLVDCEYISEADAVVMESTYGNRLHSDANPRDILQNEINTVEKDNAVLMIPSFSLEKTQELLHMINHLKQTGKVLESTPIILDSPMAFTATTIYKTHPEYMNSHIQNDHKDDPYDFTGLENIHRHEESQQIIDRSGTKVIIAGAGMMTGGRIMTHAANYLPDPKNRLFFVGYQGEDTIGREILEGAKYIKLGDKEIAVNAHVGRTDGMSAHADQAQLLKWLSSIKNVKKVFLTHGEEDSRAALAQKIEADLGHKNITLPYLNQEIVMQ